MIDQSEKSAPRTAGQTEGDLQQIQHMAQRLTENVGRVIVGRATAVRLTVVALLCEGHVLLEDVPGLGKTMLARTVAGSLNCLFKRIQFTPDLLPSDVTGLNYFNQKEGEFRFLKGPIMANVVLADEINRATPRTQSCLLEAMEERQVTVEGETMALPRPFLVLATQNPVEQEGTFPLPEAQLDRFLLRIKQGYPTAQEEDLILTRFQKENPLQNLEPVTDGEELSRMQGLCRTVLVDQPVREYILDLVRTTRSHQAVRLGASPRAAQGLLRAAQALAAVKGRAFAVPDDVKELAGPVLAHRLLIRPEARLRGAGGEELVQEILAKIKAPVEEE